MTNRAALLAFVTLTVVFLAKDCYARNHNQSSVQDLYSAKASIRSAAVERLVRAGPRAVPSLISVLNNREHPQFKRAWPLAAHVLSQMKAVEAVPSLLSLIHEDPTLNAEMKTDEAISSAEPAFKALIAIGQAGVAAIRQRLPMLDVERGYMATRVLRAIGTPDAIEGISTYVQLLHRQIDRCSPQAAK